MLEAGGASREETRVSVIEEGAKKSGILWLHLDRPGSRGTSGTKGRSTS
ncbi:hypothetical protein [Nonomuraea dietziae]